MAARGADAKKAITDKILETFKGAFVVGKDIRIPMTEGDEQLQIKVTLTAAKDWIDNEAATATTPTEINSEMVPPSDEERQQVENFVKELGF